MLIGSGTRKLVTGAALAIAAISLLLVFMAMRVRNEARKVMSGIALLKNLAQNPKSSVNGQYWTGDVAQLEREGLIPKEIGEADAAPMARLVEKPIPYYGYLFIAMRSGPEVEPGKGPVKFSEGGRTKDCYAFCAFPERYRWLGLPTYIITDTGMFYKVTELDGPVMDWPTPEEQLSWGRID